MSRVFTTGHPLEYYPAMSLKPARVQSVDLLRGLVMIIMALDHVRNYFHNDAFLYSPTDLSKTSVALFFTRWITHYCAPVFVFLAGISAYLYGVKKTKKEISIYLLTRGIWLVMAELFLVSLFRTFNPSFTYVNLQVIWAIGVCMIVLSALIHLNKYILALTGIVLIAAHNLLDPVHAPGNGVFAFTWSVLHETNHFVWGIFDVYVRYPVLPWIGIMTMGYCAGKLYEPGYIPRIRRNILLFLGISAIVLFIILRAGNFYGDASTWSAQHNFIFSLLSFLNVTKYPPSLLYTLITLGPALILLAVSEKPLQALGTSLAMYGRVPMFYYLAHILLIHLFATGAALLTGYSGMTILYTSVNSTAGLKGYGFDLPVVYIVWITIILLLYPCCKWFDRYKRANQLAHAWLSYL